MKFWSQDIARATLIVATGAFASGVNHAQTSTATAAIAAPTAPAKAQNWTATGGTVGVRWNRDLVRDLGMSLGAASARYPQLTADDHELFDLRQGDTLEFEVRNNNLAGFIGGGLQARGGYVIDGPGGNIDLTDFRLVPRSGQPFILDLVAADGKAWFYIDRLMYQLIDNNQRLAVRTMDLRITAELAQRLGNPVVADWAIADLEMTTGVTRQGANAVTLATAKWHGTPVPGVPGAVYLADLFMTDMTLQYSRCNGCTGAGGNGQTVFTPSSTLRNNINNGSLLATVAGDPRGTSSVLYTADIPWYQKFSGQFAPYNNDQHPYLIWNLYRFNTDGTMDQIGRSGVKHAFLTLNTSCLQNPGNNQILGLGCADVYSVGNNDSNNSMGPRSEIIPANNVWGRCGSIYDTNCDGLANATPNGSYDQRMIVRESQFSGATQTGATYMFESWYLARQDVNIYNSMATKRVTFTRSGSVWAVGANDQYKLGPAIDRWVDPSAPGANARTTAVATPEGNVKVAVKATDLGSGRWRYDYAVMNMDFARAQTAGTEPNLRTLSNNGFDSFIVPTGSATPTDLFFSDGDLDAANNWVASITRGSISWTAPTVAQSLNWGTMFRFSFIINQPPAANAVSLRVSASGTPKALKAGGLLVPRAR